MRVLDSIVLVTGANREIGRQFVAGLLKRRARRVCVAARRSAALAPIVALDPARVVALQVDITNRFGVEAAGRPAPDLTLLIKNVGVATFGRISATPLDAVVHDMDTTFFGTLNVVRTFLPIIERKGHAASVRFDRSC
jgi:NAD(P)-dependent dehydrogenase (short-subunit alcohol dehydrogenase family)